MTRPRTPPSFRGPERVLVPCDFSECSRAALEYAARLARPLNATVVLLHVLEPVEAGFLLEPVASPRRQGGERARARQALGEWSQRWARGVRTGRPLVKAGRPSEVIVDTADKVGAGLIVLGTRGRTGLRHVLLGSVAERVVRQARCPVLTVPARPVGDG